MMMIKQMFWGISPPGQVKAPILQTTMIEQHVVAVAQIIAYTLLCTAEQNYLTPGDLLSVELCFLRIIN